MKTDSNALYLERGSIIFLEKPFCMIYSCFVVVSLADTFYGTADIIIEKKPQTTKTEVFLCHSYDT